MLSLLCKCTRTASWETREREKTKGGSERGRKKERIDEGSRYIPWL